MAFHRGENVGPYRVVEPLGQGGMASVYKAYHSALDRYVALKVLHPAFLEDPNFLARFQREARVVAKLDHPNIVPIYDFAEHDGQPYLVMKYVHGRTLKAVLQEVTLARQAELRIVEAVGDGLSYAHQQGILHRDIKPSNVLLAEDESVYLADFGLARIAQAGESTLSNEMLLGTPQYISPEQARGERDLDEGTDIYSFGVLIYELAVGQVPFNADTPFSIIHDHIYSPLPIPSEMNPEVSEPVERVLLKALAKDREDRFETVDELVRAYRAAVVEGRSTVPVEAMPGGAAAASEPSGSKTEEPGAKRGRRWWLWPLAGLFIALFCLGGFLLLAEGNQASEAPTATDAVTMTSGPTQNSPATATQPPEVNPANLAREASRLYERGQREEARRLVLRAADMYAAEGLYVPASAVLTEAFRREGGPGEADPVLEDRAVEMTFYAGESGVRAVPVLEALWDSHPDWAPLPALSARTAIHTRGPEAEQMRESMLETLRETPDYPLGMAVLAEYHLLNQELELAQDYGRRALSHEESPAWLRNHLRDLLRD